MKFLRKLVNRLRSWLEERFPNWTHRRHRRKWERHWADPGYEPFWKTDQPQRELVEAVESGWFQKDKPAIDVGCGNGEVSRWLARQGFHALGLDYSSAAIENCRKLSADLGGLLKFELADLCAPDLSVPPAGNLIDRGCFHRIPDNFRATFARNIAGATLPGGHFLLLAGTFDDARFANYRGARSASALREHVQFVFGDYFYLERADSTVITASQEQNPMPAVAFWMIRKTEPSVVAPT